MDRFGVGGKRGNQRVKRRLTNHWCRISCGPNVSGYPQLNVGNGKVVYVHSLILLAFVGPRPDGMECRHLDGNSMNNQCSNLAWGTPTENGEDRTRHGTARNGNLRGEDCGNSILTENEVRTIVSLLLEGHTTIELAKIFGVSQPTIAAIKCGYNWTHLFTKNELKQLRKCRRSKKNASDTRSVASICLVV